ncbi:hypothetical protein AAFF_G00030300 [Aldrovandia affinis]|uniref:Uncharacterized protein n=1 Tax=Aldrovandia affinis TaxID=143900 RepID=A0AAD7WGX1_9TELE|nr:hypothetical protein AAFF_G00030300 [Aldrovandia affinis]
MKKRNIRSEWLLNDLTTEEIGRAERRRGRRVARATLGGSKGRAPVGWLTYGRGLWIGTRSIARPLPQDHSQLTDTRGDSPGATGLSVSHAGEGEQASPPPRAGRARDRTGTQRGRERTPTPHGPLSPGCHCRATRDPALLRSN